MSRQEEPVSELLRVFDRAWPSEDRHRISMRWLVARRSNGIADEDESIEWNEALAHDRVTENSVEEVECRMLAR